MSQCRNCSAELINGAQFCGECGAPVATTRRCPNCSAPLAADARFCSECGVAAPTPDTTPIPPPPKRSTTPIAPRATTTPIAAPPPPPRSLTKPPAKRGNGRLLAILLLLFIGAVAAIGTINSYGGQALALFIDPTATATIAPTSTPLTPPTLPSVSASASGESLIYSVTLTNTVGSDGKLYLGVHPDFIVNPDESEQVYLAIYFWQADGAPIPAVDVYDIDGQLANWDVIDVRNSPAIFDPNSNYTLWMPVEYLPYGFDHYATVSIIDATTGAFLDTLTTTSFDYQP